jgi:hypothetical protein
MKQVPRIYKKFVSEIVDGDHQFILKEKNIGRFEDGGDLYVIKENGDCENYQRAIKFAKENGYLLSKDISYNGFVFFEKIIDDGYYKLELQVYDDIIKKRSPKYLQYEKAANFGDSIMSKTTYSYQMSSNQSDWNSETLDELFELALRKEKELTNGSKKEPMETAEPKTIEQEIVEAIPAPEQSDLRDFTERNLANSLIDIGMSKNIAEMIVIRLYSMGNGISYLYGKSNKEELKKEFDGITSGDLDKLLDYAEKRKKSDYHIFPNSVTIKTAYDIPELVKAELSNLNIPLQKFPLPFNLDDRDALLDLTKDIIGEDDLRPTMEKVYGMENSIVFTDAHKLLFVPIAKKFRGAIDPKVQLVKGIYKTNFDKENFVEGKKGLYQKKADTKGESWHIDSKTDLERHSFMSVIPDYGEENYQGKITCAVMYRYMYFIDKYFMGGIESHKKKCSMKYKFGEDEIIAINPEFIVSIMKKFLNLGIEHVHVYASTPNRSIIFSEQKLGKMNGFASKYKAVTKATFCLVMPVILNSAEAPLASGGIGSVTNLDRNIENCLAFDITNNRVIDIDGLPCYIANSESLLSMSDFDISQKDFKRNRTELKKKYNEYVVDSWLKEAFEVFKERFKGKVYAELNYHEKKIILSLQWLYLYHPTWRY